METEEISPLLKMYREYTPEEKVYLANRKIAVLEKALKFANEKLTSIREFYHGQEAELKETKKQLKDALLIIESTGTYNGVFLINEVKNYKELSQDLTRQLNKAKEENSRQAIKELQLKKLIISPQTELHVTQPSL